jgi:putative membrane protein
LAVFITCAICLSISAIYEFVEWWTAVYEEGAADAFLGSQGDVWDTQWDMFTALIGSIVAQISLAKMHDKQMMQV